MKIFLALALFLMPRQEVVSRLFAATADGPFVTYSWGEHWSRLRGDLRGFQGEIRTFACLGPWVFAGGSGGLFLSEDYGENFRPVENWPEGAAAVTTFLTARLFALEPTIFAGTGSGLYRSTDSGFKWKRVGEGELQSAVHDMGWPGPELFVAAESGLYRSIDVGERFTKVGAGLPDSPILSLAISRFFALDPTMFAGTRGKGLFKSEDGGERFEAVGLTMLGQATVRALVWWGGLLVVGTDGGLFLTDDGGVSFRKVPAIEGHAVLSLSIPGAESDIPSDIIVGTDRGVFKSSDGGQSFRRVQEGMGEVEVRGLATFPMPPQD
ncbi:MAG: WD40/YVTN/BNR-like repeat-containing protein, partial [Vicinamibacteria bacterium]